METVRSCGVLVVRGRPIREFLLMKHAKRWDLPKGHIDEGETDVNCALRELWEETGIPAAAIELDPGFRFEHQYPVRTDRVRSGKAMKTLVMFLGELTRDVKIKTTEHPDYKWFPWNPPHHIQEQTIDPLLAAAAAWLEQKSTRDKSTMS
jgi:8-oxo-dGTP pyrophosphatase MutT (NUDIX family)